MGCSTAFEAAVAGYGSGRRRRGGGLPDKYRRADAVTLPLLEIEDDQGLAARIEAATELEVRLVGPSAASGVGKVFARALGDGWTPAGGIWTGPLARLLDVWSAAGGYEWRFVQGRIEVVRRKTVTFGLNALAGRQQYSARTSTRGSGSGQGASGAATQSVSTTATFDPWPEIEAQLERLVGEESDLVVSAGNGSVTVSGAPGC